MTDAHCHPCDIDELQADPHLRIPASLAASAWNQEQFNFHEDLKIKQENLGLSQIILCFGIHPQITAKKELYKNKKLELLGFMEEITVNKRLNAIGECGFDLYGEKYKETEKEQDEIFNFQLETAVKHELPLVLHLRRAMHKIFPHTNELKKLPSVVFHSWSGTYSEGISLINRGVNAFFSFGTAIINNHKEAQRCCAMFPAECLLFETDAPYQPPKGKNHSSWSDLGEIIQKTALFRQESGVDGSSIEELVRFSGINFLQAFKI